jgi:DNA/RNA-binding domain of Phe-tRNA-synthetase-like protein
LTFELFIPTDAWRTGHPSAACGILAMRGVANPPANPLLDQRREELEQELRERCSTGDRTVLRESGLLPAYAAYYKRWGQRYHVALQIESIALKGKGIPRVAALVESMFVAELRNQILTAGHDLAALVPPLRIDVGRGDESERYETPRGEITTVKAGDMYVADGQGVMSSIIAGPAAMARIGAETTTVLFVAYGVPGVPPERIDAHLSEIESLARAIAPTATTLLRRVYLADSSPA